MAYLAYLLYEEVMSVRLNEGVGVYSQLIFLQKVQLYMWQGTKYTSESWMKNYGSWKK